MKRGFKKQISTIEIEDVIISGLALIIIIAFLFFIIIVGYCVVEFITGNEIQKKEAIPFSQIHEVDGGTIEHECLVWVKDRGYQDIYKCSECGKRYSQKAKVYEFKED